jgi:hypothetical protein
MRLGDMPSIDQILRFIGEGILGPLIGFFSSDAVGNLSLLISAIIGVGGSYKLYMIREKRRRKRIENGIRTEIKEMDCISSLQADLESSDADPPSERIPAGSLPNANEIPTMVFEANTDEIARLEQETASEMISFYSDVQVYKELIADIKADEGRAQKENGEDYHYQVPMDRHKELYDARGELETQRQELLQQLSE